jgi:hypothetical protein
MNKGKTLVLVNRLLLDLDSNHRVRLHKSSGNRHRVRLHKSSGNRHRVRLHKSSGNRPLVSVKLRNRRRLVNRRRASVNLNSKLNRRASVNLNRRASVNLNRRASVNLHSKLRKRSGSRPLALGNRPRRLRKSSGSRPLASVNLSKVSVNHKSSGSRPLVSVNLSKVSVNRKRLHRRIRTVLTRRTQSTRLFKVKKKRRL